MDDNGFILKVVFLRLLFLGYGYKTVLLYLCPSKNISAWICPFLKGSHYITSFYITSPLYPKWSSSTLFSLLYYEVSNLVMVFPSCEGLVGPPLIVHSGRPLWPTWRPLLGGANGIAGGGEARKIELTWPEIYNTWLHNSFIIFIPFH